MKLERTPGRKSTVVVLTAPHREPRNDYDLHAWVPPGGDVAHLGALHGDPLIVILETWVGYDMRQRIEYVCTGLDDIIIEAYEK